MGIAVNTSEVVVGFPSNRKALMVRIIVVVILLPLVVGLSWLHINGTYKPYMNCAYLVGNQMKADSWVCGGANNGEYVPSMVKGVVNSPRSICQTLNNLSIPIPGITIPGDWPLVGGFVLTSQTNLPLGIGLPCPAEVTWPVFGGMAGFINPPLEWLRGLTVRTILAFFVITSLIATILYYTIIKPIRDLAVKLIRGDQQEWKQVLEKVTTCALIFGALLLLFLISVGRTGGLEPPALLQPLWTVLGWH